MEFQCERCGRCCLIAGPVLHITENDVERWQTEKRSDILRMIFPMKYSCDSCNREWGLLKGEKCPHCKKEGGVIFYWVDPKYPRDYLSQLQGSPRCPLLKEVNTDRYTCLINETKPEICRSFPILENDVVTKNEEECLKWGCEGYKKWKISQYMSKFKISNDGENPFQSILFK